MASAIDYDTVWTSIVEPVPTFGVLERYGHTSRKDAHTQDPKEWRRFGARIRDLTGGEDVDIVFEHPGLETLGVLDEELQARHVDRINAFRGR